MLLGKILPTLLGCIVALSLTGCTGEQYSNSANNELDTNIEENTAEKSVSESTMSDNMLTEVNVLANDEKIIEMLKSSGKIAEDASPEEIQQALENYLKGKAEDNRLKEKSSEKYIEDLKKQIEKDLSKED